MGQHIKIGAKGEGSPLARLNDVLAYAQPAGTEGGQLARADHGRNGGAEGSSALMTGIAQHSSHAGAAALRARDMFAVNVTPLVGRSGPQLTGQFKQELGAIAPVRAAVHQPQRGGLGCRQLLQQCPRAGPDGDAACRHRLAERLGGTQHFRFGEVNDVSATMGEQISAQQGARGPFEQVAADADPCERAAAPRRRSETG